MPEGYDQKDVTPLWLICAGLCLAYPWGERRAGPPVEHGHWRRCSDLHLRGLKRKGLVFCLSLYILNYLMPSLFLSYHVQCWCSHILLREVSSAPFCYVLYTLHYACFVLFFTIPSHPTPLQSILCISLSKFSFSSMINFFVTVWDTTVSKWLQMKPTSM